MLASDHLSTPDSHLTPAVAALYDDAHAERFTPEAVGPAVEVLHHGYWRADRSARVQSQVADLAGQISA